MTTKGYKDLERNEHFGRLDVGNILPYEARVAQRVANDVFATIDLNGLRNVLAEETFRLEDAFVDQYKGKEPAWGELGWFTFKRTYARRVDLVEGGKVVLDEKGDPKSIRTEEWTEVVRRVVEGNLNIIKNDPVVTQEYAQKMFNLIWNLVFTPPGRGLWITGTSFAERTGDAYNNCWFVETRPYHYGEDNKIFTRYKIDPYEKKVSYPFVFLFDQAMKGGGVGFSVEDKFIDEIPKVKNKVHLSFSVRKSHPDYEALEAQAEKLGTRFNKEIIRSSFTPYVRLTIADSREGWAEAYAVAIDEHFRNDGRDVFVHFDLSEVREAGRKINGFGGVASGSMPLVELLSFVSGHMNQRVGQKLSSVDCTDYHNATGRAVVAGNVRRTAEVALAKRKDVKFIQMKNYKLVGHVVKGWDTDPKTNKMYPVLKTVGELIEEGYTREEAEADYYTAWAQNNHRWASNNSVVIDDPRSYDFGFIAPNIEANGEPGIFNRFLAQNFGRIIDGYQAKKDKAQGGNPCMEIPLETDEPCNLVEYMLPVAHKLGIQHEEVIPFMVHLTKRVTFTKYDWQRSAETITTNRRIGVSISGFEDWVLLKFGRGAIAGWMLYNKDSWHDMAWLNDDVVGVFHKTQPDYDHETQVIEPIYNQALIDEMDHMYKLVVQADIEYSALLTNTLGYKVNPSVRVTTVKPSGTVALLSGISPGVHFHYFRYGIRRIKVQADDPLRKLVELAGYRTEESVDSPNSFVIEFPFKAPTADYEDFRSCDDVSIEEQFAMQSFLCVYWADNMVSCTITFQEDEKPKIESLLTQYRMRIKSTSLLPYSGHGYKQAPYEPFVTSEDGLTPEQQYTARMKEIHMRPEELYHILMNQGLFEDRQMDLAEMVECTGGVCPTK